MLPGDAVATPVAIRLLNDARCLEIEWLDGQTSSVTHLILRNSCRCGACVAQRRQGLEMDASQQTVLTSVEACGAGALQLTFSDGHNKGIYPFAYLKSLAR